MDGAVHTTPIPALGTSWWLEIFDDVDNQTRQQAHSVLTGFLETFEARYSRFRTDSWLSQLNTKRVCHNPETEFVALLKYGLNAYTQTSGVFNLLIGNELIARGYDRDYRFTPSSPPPPLPNPHEIIEISDQIIQLTKDWTIDIGGFGKGYAIDGAVKELRALGLQYFLINGGGDLFVTNDHGQPVTIYLEHPTESNLSIGSIKLQNSGFAASSPFKRQWHADNRVYSHLMPTRTQSGAVATFVVADSARTADVFATTCALVDEVVAATLAQTHKLPMARYNPATKEWWSMNWPQ